jgi:hypothetical protein
MLIVRLLVPLISIGVARAMGFVKIFRFESYNLGLWDGVIKVGVRTMFFVWFLWID